MQAKSRKFQFQRSHRKAFAAFAAIAVLYGLLLVGVAMLLGPAVMVPGTLGGVLLGFYTKPWTQRRFGYDPCNDLMDLQCRLNSEVYARAKNGELTPDQVRSAMRLSKPLIEAQIIYATIGRDRRKLTPEFVEHTEMAIRRNWATWRPLWKPNR